jgi:cation diffusion facilitator family transporter
MASGSYRVVCAALAANLAIAGFKLVVSIVTRSTAMMAEACHSAADTANQGFLLIGMWRGGRRPDAKHPFGYATEHYFWAFMVALCLFSVGAAFSIYAGARRLAHPEQAFEHLGWAFAVLGVSFALELGSFRVALREFTTLRGGRTWVQTLRDARDPTVVAVLFEDAAALVGLVFATAGLALATWTGDARWDGAASIAVGLALGCVAYLLARECRDLLLGESVPPAARERLESIVRAQPGVLALLHARTMHLGPEEALAAIKVKFDDALSVREIEAAIDAMEKRLRQELPVLRRIYVEAGGWPAAQPDGRGRRAT